MKWISEGWPVLWHAVVTAIALIVVMTFFVRLNGLRSFAKMSSIDFVTTITIGSVMSTTLMTDGSSIVKGGLVIGLLLVIQTGLSRLKIKFDWFAKLLENKPLLLMKDGEFLKENLLKSNISRSDVIAKLREANAIDLDKVHAVILETTGDISVLHGEQKPDPKCVLYDDVRTS